MINRPLKIVFCFPCREVSGVPVLFQLMANYLSSNANYVVSVVDYPDGYMAREIDKSKVNLIPYVKSGTVVPNNAILVLQSMTPWSLFPYLKIPIKTKMFFWTLHPNNFTPNIRIESLFSYPRLYRFFYKTALYFYWKKIKLFINELIDKQAHVFMDGNTKQMTQLFTGFNISESEQFLPVPVDPKYYTDVKKAVGISQKKEIQIVNMGRLVDWKINLLIPVIQEMASYASENKIHIKFNVIGEGPSYAKVLHLDSLNSEFFSLNMIGRLEDNCLSKFLDDQDIMIAMGTCALIGAMKSLPVIRLDISSKIEKCFTAYQMLYEGENFTLGNNIASFKNQEGRSLYDIMDKIRSEYVEESIKTNNYVLKNFNLTTIAENLLSYLEATTLTYQDFLNLKLNERGFIYTALLFLKSKTALVSGKKHD